MQTCTLYELYTLHFHFAVYLSVRFLAHALAENAEEGEINIYVDQIYVLSFHILLLGVNTVCLVLMLVWRKGDGLLSRGIILTSTVQCT